MLLKRLKLKNFLIYEDVDLDLSSIKLASIVGQFASDRRRSNGAGKTAFLESIRYALYDQTRSKFKQDIVRVGTRTSTVELICDIGGKVVRVWRQRLADATSAATLHIDGKPAGDKIKVVNETLQSLIGIDVDLFDSIYFFKQGDHFSFAEANPTDRKNALAKVFRMDALNKCADLAKKRRSDKENELAKAKGAAETLGSQLNSRVPYQTIVEQELAISAELATAKQLDAAYTALHSENALDAQFLDENYKAFQSEIQDDLNNVSIIHRSIQAVTGKIAEQQVLRQRDDSKAGQLKQLIAADESRIAAYDGIDVDAAKSDAAKLVADCEVASRQAIGLFYTAQAELKLLSNRQVNVDAGATCPTCQQFVPAEHVEACAAKARKQAEALTKKVDDGRTAKSLAEQNLQKAKDKLAEIEQVIPIRKNVDFLYDNLREVRSRLKACDEEIDKLTTERNELFARQGEAEARVDKDFVLSYQSAVDKLYLPASRMLRTSALGRQADIRRNIEKLTAEHAKLVKELQDAKQQAADYEAAVARCKQIESNYIVYDRLYEIFGRNGIQAIMIENAIGVIETFANDILKQMQTRFVVSLRTTKETKAGDIRESLDIIVFDNGSEKPFENYSGGEKALINIALRLSLSKVISALHGIKMQSLFLDEVLGALDGPNREEVVKILSYLSRSFDQVFVVSHTDEIQDVIDSSIIIERYDSHSEIKLTHGRN